MRLIAFHRDRDYPQIDRVSSAYTPLHSFRLEEEKHYQQQYGDMYFLRLAKLKPAVEEMATEAWSDIEVRVQHNALILQMLTTLR